MEERVLKKQSSALIVLALFLFFPVIIYTPSASAQEDVMEFVMAYYQDFENLNPLFGLKGRSQWYFMCVYDSLLSYDDNLNLIPWLAEYYDVSSDGFRVTFTLREGAKWHDGQPVTPEDVKFTFEYARDGPTGIRFHHITQHISDVTVNGRDIVVNFDEVVNWAVDVLGNVPILPKHIREGVAQDAAIWEDHTNTTAHIGSGMFKYVMRVPGDYTALERFDDWWGPENPHVGQLPNIERLRIDVVRTQEARILAMINGDVDTELYEVQGAFVNTVLDAPELKLITGTPTVWWYTLGMNTVLPGLDDIEVRRAIAYAIDRQDLINRARLGFGTATMSIIPDAFYSELYHIDGNFPVHNITIAMQTLDAAGWIDTDMNGVRDNGAGVELSYDLCVESSDPIGVSTGIGIKPQLEKIGIEVNVVPLAYLVFTQGIYMVPRTFETCVLYSQIHAVPNHPLWSMHSDEYVDNGLNPYGCINTTLDEILDDYKSATRSEFLEAARAVQKAATENMPYIPLYISDDTHAIRAEWTNFSQKPGGSFTTIAPETMVFMYDEEYNPPPAPGIDLILLAGVGVGSFVAGVAVTHITYRRRQ
ncbi:MAG: ABC transporter substrate-binding protein [Promethearchaeota archaeon]